MEAYILVIDGSEEIELVTVLDLLRRAEIPTKIASVTTQRKLNGAHGLVFNSDCTLKDVNLDKALALILPGGMPGAENLCQSKSLLALLEEADRRNILIGAICAAPLVLGRIGLLRGRKATCYSGFEEELLGAEILDQTTVTDGNIVTSVGVMSAIEFALTLIEQIKGSDAAQAVRSAIYVK